MIVALREHIKNKFETASVDESPFPHLIIQNFFPDEVYDKIMAYNPFNKNEGVEWLSKDHSQNVSSRTPYFARKQINFHMDQPFESSPEQSEFWDTIKECFLADDWFPKLVVSKFGSLFRFRFGGIIDDSDFTSLFRRELFLQRHEPGYYIGPHTDIPTRVFTCIFSFASTAGYEQYGTELLAPINRLDRCWGNDHYAMEEFTVEKLAPYTPNNFLLFHKTRHSFHSVRAIDNSVPNQRYGMQFQFYEPEGGLFNDRSAPNLMHITRPRKRGIKDAIKKLVA